MKYEPLVSSFSQTFPYFYMQSCNNTTDWNPLLIDALCVSVFCLSYSTGWQPVRTASQKKERAINALYFSLKKKNCFAFNCLFGLWHEISCFPKERQIVT